jgi:CheY-like chemotaxis protein
MERLLKSVNRAKELVGQILTFTCQDKYGKKPVDMAIIIKNVLKLIKAGLDKNIEIYQNILTSESVIMAMSMQMNELVMNLCMNSIDAMDEKGGKLELTIEDEEISENNNLCLTGGTYLKLIVSDTGCGIPDNIIERIYDPFFTTKGLTQATGMGLSVVYGIVKSCNGAIQVCSKPGKGTTFSLYFPKIAVEEIQEFPEMINIPRGKETILFVDDEEFFLEVAQNMFERLGYKVVTTNSSLEAIKIFSDKPEMFDIIMTDYGMIRMTGIEFAKEAMKLRPDIPVILCTGFGDMITLEKVKSEGIKDLIMKPFGMKEIAEVVRKILDEHIAGKSEERTGNREQDLRLY